MASSADAPNAPNAPEFVPVVAHPHGGGVACDPQSVHPVEKIAKAAVAHLHPVDQKTSTGPVRTFPPDARVEERPYWPAPRKDWLTGAREVFEVRKGVVPEGLVHLVVFCGGPTPAGGSACLAERVIVENRQLTLLMHCHLRIVDALVQSPTFSDVAHVPPAAKVRGMPSPLGSSGRRDGGPVR